MNQLYSSRLSTSHQKVIVKSTLNQWTWIAFMLVLFGQPSVDALHNQLCFRAVKNDGDVPESIGAIDAIKINGTVDDTEVIKIEDLYKPKDNAVRYGTYDVKIRPIKYNEEYLFGWFNVRISDRCAGETCSVPDQEEGHPKNRLLRRVMIQPQSNAKDFIPGEFVPTPYFDHSESCKAQTANWKEVPGYTDTTVYPKLGKKNYVPCLYAADPSPTVPYGFSYYSHMNESWGPWSLNVNFRITFPICGIFNHDVGLYFHIYIISGKSGANNGKSTFPYQYEVFFQEYVGGAYDPEPPKGANLNCDKTLYILRNTSEYPVWINRTLNPRLLSEEDFKMNEDCTRNAAVVANKSMPYNPLFYGRCKYLDPKKYSVDWDNKNFCLHNNSYWENNTIVPFWVKPNRTDCPELNCTAFERRILITGLSTHSDIGKRVFSYRRGHGLFMILAATMGAPLSHFFARFYKETFLRNRIVNLHIWYSIHLNFVIMTFLALFAAQVSGVASGLFMGHSTLLAGKLHVYLGWANIGIYVIVFILNGLRSQSPTPRLVTIFLHFLGGKFFSFLNIVLMISSCFIPGSPSGRGNPHIGGLTFEIFLLPLFIWVVFDLIITIAMNVFLMSSDKERKIRVKRRWAIFPIFGVPIPVLRPYFNKDLDGAQLRKIILVIYCLTSFLVTIALIVLLMTSSTAGRSFGPMSGKDDGTVFVD